MTIRNDAATAVAIAQIFASTAANRLLLKDEAYRPAMLIQPITEAQRRKATNALGFDDESSPLLCTYKPIYYKIVTKCWSKHAYL